MFLNVCSLCKRWAKKRAYRERKYMFVNLPSQLKPLQKLLKKLEVRNSVDDRSYRGFQKSRCIDKGALLS